MTIALQTTGLRPHQIELLKRTIAADCSRDEFELFIETAQRSGLDPFRRQIVPLVLGKQSQARRRMIVMVTLEGLRVIANRCGNYRAASEPAHYRTDRRAKAPGNPIGLLLARVTLWQRDPAGTWFPIAGEAYWDEFAPVRQDSGQQEHGPEARVPLDPSSPWARMPRLMLAKCATAQALRAGWPEEFGGLHTEEEMERARLFDGSEKAADPVGPRAPARDGLMITWDGAALEHVPLAEFGSLAFAWLNAPERTPGDVTAWAETNRHALREFWGRSPDEALRLKRLVEARSRAEPAAAPAGAGEPGEAAASDAAHEAGAETRATSNPVPRPSRRRVRQHAPAAGEETLR